jgi:hypothetical protein
MHAWRGAGCVNRNQSTAAKWPVAWLIEDVQVQGEFLSFLAGLGRVARSDLPLKRGATFNHPRGGGSEGSVDGRVPGPPQEGSLRLRGVR